MSAMDLLIEAQEAYVSDPDLGTSEPIEVKHKDGELISNLRAFVQMGTFDKKAKGYQSNTRLFSNVILARKPEKGSLVYYKGEVWQVTEPRGSNGMYILEAQSGVKKTMGKSSSALRL